MRRRQELGVISRGIRLLPGNFSNKVVLAQFLVEDDAAPMRLDVVEVHPDGTVLGEQRPYLANPVPQKGEPNGVGDVVLVMGERLPCVERRVDVDQFHLAEILLCVRRDLGKGIQHMHRVAGDQEVVISRSGKPRWAVFRSQCLETAHLVEESDLGHSIVRRVDEGVVVSSVPGGQESLVLVGPGEFETTLVPGCRVRGHAAFPCGSEVPPILSDARTLGCQSGDPRPCLSVGSTIQSSGVSATGVVSAWAVLAATGRRAAARPADRPNARPGRRRRHGP